MCYRLLYFSLLTLGYSQSENDCDSSWSVHKRRCYFVGALHVNHSFASAHCDLLNATLVSIADLQENMFVDTLRQDNDVKWIGLVKIAAGSDMDLRRGWAWTDGTAYDPAIWHDWSVHEPSEGETCARMVDDMWWGGRCETQHGYVCEKAGLRFKPTGSPSSHKGLTGGIIVLGLLLVASSVAALIFYRRWRRSKHKRLMDKRVTIIYGNVVEDNVTMDLPPSPAANVVMTGYTDHVDGSSKNKAAVNQRKSENELLLDADDETVVYDGARY